jgi:hypothetical protein
MEKSKRDKKKRGLACTRPRLLDMQVQLAVSSTHTMSNVERDAVID